MLWYIIKRIMQIIPMLLVVAFVVFFMLRLIPGDPVANMLGNDLTEEALAAMRVKLGFDKPLPEQFVNFIRNAVKGDLGTSIYTKKPVMDEIRSKMANTLKLAFGGICVASVVGIFFGILSAVKHNKFTDNFIMVLSLLSVSTPSFFLALILMLIFSLYLGWLPSMGLKTPLSYVLPVVTLGAQGIGIIARTTRSAMLDVLSQDYIRTSRSRGIPENVVVFSHALKNALIPVITVIGLRFGGLLAGATIVETIFSVPGMGRYIVDGVSKRDYPVVQGGVLVMAAAFVVINLIVDILYSFVDPRIKCE